MVTPEVTVEDLQRIEAERRAAQPPAPEPKRIEERTPPTSEQIAAADRRARERDIQYRIDARRQRLSRVFAGRDRYRECTLDNFDTPTGEHQAAVAKVQSVIDALPEARGLVLFGPPGTGKDHLMAAAIRAAVVDFNANVAWRNGMDLFGDVRDLMSDDADERSFVQQLIAPRVLALSDPLPPFGDLTQFQAATLFRVIDGRYSRGLATWVTLNVANAEEASKRLGRQIVDRLTHGAVVVPCNWPSYRRPFDAFNTGETG